MKNELDWVPSKYEQHRGRLRGSRDARKLGVGSRLVADLVAAQFSCILPEHARGRLIDLGCGAVPLYGFYREYVTETVCIDWHDGKHVDFVCDLTKDIPLESKSFQTIVLSDVLEHIAEPQHLWTEMNRLLDTGGRILASVPFMYWIHEQPNDYFRYTRFALERAASKNGFSLIHMTAVGGALDVLADVLAKLLVRVPLIGGSASQLVQFCIGTIGKIGYGGQLRKKTREHMPLAYCFVAEKIDDL